MMKYPKALENLIDNFKLLPGIGGKTAERLVFFILELDEQRIKSFSDSILNVAINIKKCSICGNITEHIECEICQDDSRKKRILCVVEDAKNIVLFENYNIFDGRYHVLDGLISPFKGIEPEDINIKKLIIRVKNERIKEVIIALKPSLEGEATSLYILRKLKGMGVIVSKIAQGIPAGAEMDYLDAVTLEMAMKDRKKFS